MYTIENLKKKSFGYSEDENIIKFFVDNNVSITVDKNEPNNIFRNQYNQIYSISKDGGETWQVALTNNICPYCKRERIFFNDNL